MLLRRSSRQVGLVSLISNGKRRRGFDRLALAALPGFVARKNGLLINIASVVALAPDLLNGTYSGTKAYVVNFTQALRNEVESTGVIVQVVLPGATATPFWAKAGHPVEDLPSEIVMVAEDNHLP